MDKRVDPPDQNNRPGGVWVQLTNPSPREGQTADGGTVELSVEIIHRSAQPLHSPCIEYGLLSTGWPCSPRGLLQHDRGGPAGRGWAVGPEPVPAPCERIATPCVVTHTVSSHTRVVTTPCHHTHSTALHGMALITSGLAGRAAPDRVLALPPALHVQGAGRADDLLQLRTHAMHALCQSGLPGNAPAV